MLNKPKNGTKGGVTDREIKRLENILGNQSKRVDRERYGERMRKGKREKRDRGKKRGNGDRGGKRDERGERERREREKDIEK